MLLGLPLFFISVTPAGLSVVGDGRQIGWHDLLYVRQAHRCLLDHEVLDVHWDETIQAADDDLPAGTLVGVLRIWNEFETGDWYVHSNDTTV